MGDQTQTPQPEGTVPESEEWVTGQGGPSFSQAGMSPGGSEMENWKAPPAAADAGQEEEPPVEQQAEGLLDHLKKD